MRRRIRSSEPDQCLISPEFRVYSLNLFANLSLFSNLSLSPPPREEKTGLEKNPLQRKTLSNINLRPEKCLILINSRGLIPSSLNIDNPLLYPKVQNLDHKFVPKIEHNLMNRCGNVEKS
jgi:hypothetical protein